MSAVATVVRAELVAGETPSCRICRRSQFDAYNSALICTEPRAPVSLIAIKPRFTEQAYERRCRDVAARCKFYQEEQ